MHLVVNFARVEKTIPIVTNFTSCLKMSNFNFTLNYIARLLNTMYNQNYKFNAKKKTIPYN